MNFGHRWKPISSGGRPLPCCRWVATEQHAGLLSLAVDSILVENAWPATRREPLGIPVFPALPYGITPYFLAYPGTGQPASV